MSQFTSKELTSGKYSFQLLDETLTPVPAASLTAATLTVYDVASGAIVNSRSNQDVKNVNQVTIDASGNVAWAFLPADMAILVDANPQERRRAEFVFTWSGGAKRYNHSADFIVPNERIIP